MHTNLFFFCSILENNLQYEKTSLCISFYVLSSVFCFEVFASYCKTAESSHMSLTKKVNPGFHFADLSAVALNESSPQVFCRC